VLEPCSDADFDAAVLGLQDRRPGFACEIPYGDRPCGRAAVYVCLHHVCRGGMARMTVCRGCVRTIDLLWVKYLVTGVLMGCDNCGFVARALSDAYRDLRPLRL